jgi:hypothetical protein
VAVAAKAWHSHRHDSSTQTLTQTAIATRSVRLGSTLSAEVRREGKGKESQVYDIVCYLSATVQRLVETTQW